MKAKETVRTEMRSRLNALSPDEARQLGMRIQRNVMDSQIFRSANSIASYLAIPGEVPTAAIHSECLGLGKDLAVPYAPDGGGSYALAAVEPGTRMRTGPLGISEPAEPRTVDIQAIEVCIVPGLAFDRAGNRLGKGAGVYDRLLENFKGPKIGLAFEFQCLQRVPSVKHDVQMDFVVTEEGFFKTEK